MNLGQENEKQEFKLGLGQLDKGLRSLSAMLNRNTEGAVFFGVDDDGTVKGLAIGKRTLLDIRSRAAELIEPRIILDIQDLKDEMGRDYIRVHAEGANIPYSCDGRYYLRTAASDEQIGSELLRKMLVSGNTDLLMQITSEDQTLTFQGMIGYLKNRGVHAAETREFLNSFGMFNKSERFNLLAYLLSDQNDMIIKVMRFAGKDKTIVDERSIFRKQSILLTVQQVLDYFKLIDLPQKVNLTTGIRSETPLFDLQSFREAWINACVHNTWTDKIPPSIYIYDDRVEVVSYGGLPYGLSEDGFYAGTSKPVNQRLFNVFITCGFSEQSGHGIPQIVKMYGKEAFCFRDGLLIVTIPFAYEPDHVKARLMKERAEEQLTNNQYTVLQYLSDHPRATLQETADACNLSLGGVKKIVHKLQELELMERKGAKNKTTWVVNG
ncbi:MAG: putative DNA binding domain-containing protein [Oscillospiraceae bacterium]|nr:putative DNA binding domain-containing protein [Oscillospiraceae bacterium]